MHTESSYPYPKIVQALKGSEISWVIFDVGGVFVRLRNEVARWELASKLELSNEELRAIYSGARPEFDGESLLSAFGIGQLSVEQFIDIVAEESGCQSRDVIIQGHNAELDGEDQAMVHFIKGLASVFPTSCFSNTNKMHWDYLLTNHAPIFAHFRHVMASHLAGVAKPGEEAFHYMSATVGVPIEQCLFIDDREDNIEGARSAGGKGIVFTSLSQLVGDLLRDPNSL